MQKYTQCKRKDFRYMRVFSDFEMNTIKMFESQAVIEWIQCWPDI